MDINQLPAEDFLKMRRFKSPEEDSNSLDNTLKRDPLKVKLKLSKTEHESSSEQSPGTRICHYCGREFANGKALGGHIRIHTQGMKNNKLKQTSDLSPNNKHGKDVWEKEHTCSICDRTFPSEKSLFGHMRFHPERTYRGARPPNSEEQSKTSSSSSSEESVQEIEETESYVDGEVSALTGRGGELLKDLPNWSKTDKRGRQSACEAARCLMKLSSLTSREVLLELNGCKHKAESPLKKLKLEGGSAVEARKGKELVAQSRALKNKGLNAKSAEGPSQSSSKVRFQCSTCGRTFATFQALGGHRSSHNREKGSTTTASASHNNQTPRTSSPCPLLEASGSTGVAAATGGSPGQVQKNPDVAGGAHTCGICSRSFGTGQALGGHKRCHWMTTVEQRLRNSADQSSLGLKDDSSTGDQTSQVGPRAVEIDLNKLPPMDDEDGSVSALD